MADAKKSTQKAKFEAHLHEGAGTKGERRGVQYTRLDGERAPEVARKAMKFVSSFTQEEAEFLKGLKPGDEFVVVKVENKWTDKEGKEATTWNLDTAKDISTWVEPAPRKPWTGGAGGREKREWKDNGPASKIGGLYHDAATILSRRGDIDALSTDFIASKMAELVRAMVKDAIQIEKEITSSPGSAGKETVQQVVVPEPVVAKNATTQKDDFFSGINDVQWQE